MLLIFSSARSTLGIIDLDFALADQVNEGDWTIRARHEKYVAEKTFKVVEYCMSYLNFLSLSTLFQGLRSGMST